VTGLTLFSLGASFNYLISLFYRRPVRHGLFGRPLFAQPLERHFWWLGLAALGAGLVSGGLSLTLGLQGWPISRLWLYLLGSALMILMGVQLVGDWIMLRVLAELSHRSPLDPLPPIP
jgi:hypothetical protein